VSNGDGTFSSGFGLSGLSPTGTLRAFSGISGDTVTWPILNGNGNFPSAADIIGAFSKVRVVSAGMSVFPTTSALDNAGKIIATEVPGDVYIPGVHTDSPFDEGGQLSLLSSFTNNFTTIETPINKGGVTLKYRPTDFESFMYNDPNIDADVGLTPFVYYGNLAFIVMGVSATFTAEVLVAINYEAIPKNASLSLFTPSASRHDPVDQAMTMNAINSKSAIVAGTGQAQRSAVSGIKATNTPSGPSFFEKLLSGFAKYGPMVAEAVGAFLA